MYKKEYKNIYMDTQISFAKNYMPRMLCDLLSNIVIH